MQLILPSFEIIEVMAPGFSLELIEKAGRTCYKSEDKIGDPYWTKRFVQGLLTNNHESVLEHSAMTVKFICDRGVSHELIRHRLASFSQESTRYCCYKNRITFVIPPWCDDIKEGDYTDLFRSSTHDEMQTLYIQSTLWMEAMLNAENTYKDLIKFGWSPQEARTVLPNSLKTELVVTTNFREWRHIFKLRCSKAAHPQMREIMLPLLQEIKSKIPVVFDDIKITE